MSITEPIFYTVPSRFLDATIYDEREKHFMVSLCAYLGLHDVDRDDVDNMKEAVLRFISNHVEGWIKCSDPNRLHDTVKGAFKMLCEAQSWLRNREGSPQIYWEAVILNHIKLVSTYSHCLTLPASN